MDDPRHTTLCCPRGHGPMEPVDAPAGEPTRRFECLMCRNAGSVPVRLLTPRPVRRRLVLAGAR